LEQPEVLFTSDEIDETVNRLAREIDADYRDTRPLLIGVLQGSFVFLADLIRRLEIPVEVDFVRLSSYGSGMESSRQVKLIHDLEKSIAGRDIIVVEDIIDTGITLWRFMRDLRRRNPASVRLCALIDKTARRETDVTIDYVGFRIHDEFVVGYGIDCNEQFRHLPDICHVKEIPE
jgi:hypoxanthine phosphoribosyltransferase